MTIVGRPRIVAKLHLVGVGTNHGDAFQRLRVERQQGIGIFEQHQTLVGQLPSGGHGSCGVYAFAPVKGVGASVFK